MVVAEILTGISLVKASADFIRNNVAVAKDISSLASSIDDLFRGESEVNKAANKKSGVGIVDQFGVESVAQEYVNRKLKDEQIAEVKNLLNLRFGPNTWSEILVERQKRIQAARDAKIAANRAALARHNEMMENVKVGSFVVIILTIAIGLLMWALVIST